MLLRSVVLFLTLTLAGCEVPAPQVPPSGQELSGLLSVRDAAEVTAAKAALPTIPVKGRAPKTGYDASLFRWKDMDRNGCGTRDDMLKRDLTNDVFKSGSACVVVAGTLRDPYTATTVQFAKAEASKVPIDHIYPRALAWQFGAAKWTDQKRLEFANDPLNLQATTQKANSSKGDSSPASWMPVKSGWCRYSTKFVLVTKKYGLALGAADIDMLRRGLASCNA